MRFSSLSAAVRDGLLSAAIVLVTGLTIGTFVYISAAGALKREVQSNLINLAKSAAGLTDMKAHAGITRPDQRGGDQYNQVQTPYRVLLNSNHDIAYIYTMIKPAGDIQFIMDASLPKPGEEEIPTEVLEVYSDATATLKAAFEAKDIRVEDETYSDKWGTFLSAYAPLYDGEVFVGMIGVDIRADAFLKRIHSLQVALALGGLLAFAAAVGAGILTWRIRRAATASETSARHQAEELMRLQAQRLEEEREKGQREAERGEAISEQARAFRTSVGELLNGFSATADQLSLRADGVSEVSVRTSKDALEATATSESAVARSRSAVTAAHELTASIQDIARHSDESRQVAAAASDTAAEAAQHLRHLSTSSARVGDVITIISDIASQINLLALNATIESARAGEAGKGFAVVATEVKNLSSRVASASQDITRQIQDVQTATDTTARSVEQISEVITRVVETSASVAAALEQQRAATWDIENHITASVESVEGIRSSLERVQAAAQDTGKNAEDVRSGIGALRTAAKALATRIDDFATRMNG
ncbi:methyl-accepting chemotaxis protein MCP signaling domain protein [Asticcacaulis biprosthecium C19]|uniref:Methyl-accepting chemotaxis protein MCP signaling domain protein n=1 Tax=Asticcacaulis biprosthecium C19 TaxID=715226 RepID=F4QM76_9CAUL|nr:methyl-accepting chemotaxis protein [Asticcacaulis biprosthecium]EGF91317.1 methyl-accepting chemotaxis protein MCP signaling domain protein [Asticcacaulis biprosthecium C19]